MNRISRRWKILAVSLLFTILVLGPIFTIGAYWVRDVGLLNGQAMIFGSDSANIDKMMATILKGLYNDRLQLCDGDSDEDEFNTAILSMPNDYGTVVMDAATFTVDGSIELQHGIKLVGAGKVASTIKCEASTSISTGIIHADGHWNRGLLEDFTVDGNEDNSGDCMGLYIQGAWYSQVNRIEVKDCEDDGVLITGPDGGGYTGECHFEFVEVHDIQSDGWHISAVMDSYWANCYEFNAEEDGFHIIGNSNEFIHCHAWNDGWNAFEISSDAKHCKFLYCNADEPGFHGFKIQSYENQFIGCTVGGASQHGSNYDGFHVDSTWNIIVDAHIADADGGMEYAIYEDSGGDYNTFETCMISDYAVAGVYTQGAHTTCRFNKGWITESEGTAVLLSGTTSIDVAHGLDVTPADGDIVLTLCENPDSANDFWVGNYNSDNFTIYCDTDPGDNITVAWKAQAW